MSRVPSKVQSIGMLDINSQLNESINQVLTPMKEKQEEGTDENEDD